MTTSAARSGPLVIVEWADSCALKAGVWSDPDELAPIHPSRCVSVGWVFAETKDHVVLFAHGNEHQVGGELCIPKSAIVKRYVLRDPTKKR